MTILTVTQANLGTKIFGLTSGQAVFTDRESPCFWFATAPNGRELKISKRTKRMCNWGSQNTSPVFSEVEFEPNEDADAWMKADEELIRKN